jgi:glycosyltransferase involved in cell wall biosynthesis
LKQAIASKNYSDRIFLTGDVEHKIVLHLIKKADILLRTTKFDGDAIAVREALFL